eukprot:8081210-Pyramimonas_sp.AAC.1
MLGQKTCKPLETSTQNGRERDREITTGSSPQGKLKPAHAAPATSSQSAPKTQDVGTENMQTA